MVENDSQVAVDPPSAWVVRFAPAVPKGGQVLDLACGAGRHTRLFLGLGHPVLAVDRDTSWLADILATEGLTVVAEDLEAAQDARPSGFANARFAGVVVTNYLHRPLLPWIAAAVQPGGILVYETFAEGNERFGHPRNPDFLLRPGELLEAFGGVLQVLAYEHGLVEHGGKKAVTQRIAASRRSAI